MMGVRASGIGMCYCKSNREDKLIKKLNRDN